eukprot:61427_1
MATEEAQQQQIESNHRKRRSNMSLSLMDLQKKTNVATLDPLTEIEDLRAEKELLMTAYEKIDVEDNGDIELEEFTNGMQDLDVDLTDDEIAQVFKLMDSDNSTYVDRNEFIMFLTQRFESSELTRFQEAILIKVRGKKHKRGASLIKNENEGLDGMQLSAAEREMREAMMQMANQEVQAVQQEEKLYDKLEEQEQKDPNFGKTENCENWTTFEVAAWLETVKLNEYMTAFMQIGVDGSSLLYDLDRHSMMTELGVKRVHIEKLIRAIRELRDEIRTDWDECENVIDIPYLPQIRATDTVAELEGEISSKNEQIEQLKKDYESRIKQLLLKIEEKDSIINKAVEDGFIFNDDGGGDGVNTEDDLSDNSVYNSDEDDDEYTDNKSKN